MEVTGPGSARPAGVRWATPPAVRPADVPAAPARGDRVEISDVARQLQRLEEVGRAVGADGLRAERLAEIRRQIESGTYETTERLDAALARFLAETGGGR